MIDVLRRYLHDRANARGLVLTREGRLRRHLGCSGSDLTASLAELERSGEIEILSPLPFLVLRLRIWPGKATNSARTAPSAYGYESYPSQSKMIKDSYRRPASSSAPADANLLQEILDTLGEDDPTTFRQALTHYSPSVIRLTLARVRAMKWIRKSRTAVFRYLLPRIAREAAHAK